MQDNNLPPSDTESEAIEEINADFNNDKLFENYTFPPLVKRVKALFIDSLVMLVIFFIAYSIIQAIGDAPGWLRGFIIIFMFFLYDPLFVAFLGGTLGHHAMKIRIRRINDPEKKI